MACSFFCLVFLGLIGCSTIDKMAGLLKSSDNDAEADMNLVAQAVSFDSSGDEADIVGTKLEPGDSVVIDLRGIPAPVRIEDNVDEYGDIGMPYIGSVKAAGLSTSQLERDIHKAYIDKQIFKDLSVTVNVPSRVFFIRGEVRGPGRYRHFTGMTLLQAIAGAGGYTDYAKPSKIKILRAGEQIVKDASDIEDNPELDLPLMPGDVIVVPRSFL